MNACLWDRCLANACILHAPSPSRAMLIMAMLHALAASDTIPHNIPLVSFAPDADPSLTHNWTTLNGDPVMSGRSYSAVSISDDVLTFTGKCAIVPALGALGITTAAKGRGDGGLSPETFVDVSSCQGLTIVAKDYSDGYSGYRISFGDGHVPGTHHAYGFVTPPGLESLPL